MQKIVSCFFHVEVGNCKFHIFRSSNLSYIYKEKTVHVTLNFVKSIKKLLGLITLLLLTLKAKTVVSTVSLKYKERGGRVQIQYCCNSVSAWLQCHRREFNQNLEVF